MSHDKKFVRFYLPLQPANPDDAIWSVIRTLADKIGEQLTTHGVRDIDDNRLGLGDVEADIIGRSYEYLNLLVSLVKILYR